MKAIKKPEKTETAGVPLWQLIGGIAGVVAMIVLLAWSANKVLANRQEQKQLAKVKDMGKELFGDASKDLPREERRAKWEEFREEVKKLPEDKRDQLRDESRQEFQKREKQKYDKYFKADPKEQRAMLDEDIKREEEMRKRFQERAKGGGGNRGGGDANRGGGGDAKRGGGGDANRGGGGAPPGGAGDNSSNSGNNSGGRRGAMTEDKRKQILDHTDPEFRAEAAAYRQALRDRRQQLGLPASPWGGGGGGAPRGGSGRSSRGGV